MKTKLRLIGSLTAGLILVGGLSACGSDDAKGGTTTTKAEGTVTTKAEGTATTAKAEGTATTAKAAETTTTKK